MVSILALLLAVSSGNARPDWLTGEGGKYPRALYVVGVGSADDRQTAEERARAELSRVFSVEVTATRTSQETDSRTSGTGGSQHAASQFVSDDTRSTTAKVLEGVEIAEAWTDPATHQTYALAVLNKDQAARRFEARLTAIEAGAVPLRLALRDADKARAMGAAMKLLRVEDDRRAVQQDVRIVKPDAALGAFREPLAHEFLSHLTVGLTVDGDSSGLVARALQAAFANVGITTTADATKADLVSEAKLTVNDMGERQGWYWSRANVDLVVRQPASRSVALHLTESARGSSQLPAECGRRGVAKVAEQLKSAVPTAFVQWSAGR